MPHDPELAERMNGALGQRPDVVRKRMFGGYCWMLNGNMLCGVEVGRYMFRVRKEQERAALARPGAKPMDITGRPMAGFIWVSATGLTARQLRSWIKTAERYVGSLSPK